MRFIRKPDVPRRHVETLQAREEVHALRRGVGDVVVAVTRGAREPVECGGAYAPAWVSQAGVFSA